MKTVYTFGAELTGSVAPCIDISRPYDNGDISITVRDCGVTAQIWLHIDEALKMGLGLVKEGAPDFALLGDAETVAAIKQMPPEAFK